MRVFRGIPIDANGKRQNTLLTLNTLLANRHSTQILDSRREVRTIRSQTKLNPQLIVRLLEVWLG